MQFRSTRSETQVSFKDAVLRCLPQDGGLYVPAAVTDMRQFFLYMDEGTSYPELTATVTPSLLQGELNPFAASLVAESAFSFEPELLRLDERFSVLNLCNGPTGVFKDFGVAFLAAVMEELLKNSGPAMVLSASRGDTGVSNARAFYRRQGITSVILYPLGPIRGLDPAMFVPNGGNIIPIQVEGTFDDCQRLIAAALHDRSFAERYGLTCANAINVGRLLPQAFYYLYGFTHIKKELQGDLIFSVPSGNFGNLIAGLYAWKFGMPVNGFIAAMNINSAFDGFGPDKEIKPRPLTPTCSPALDVSYPSNYERLLAFYEEAPAVMRHMVYPHTVDDAETLAALERVWKRYGLFLDSHSAVAFAAAERMASYLNFNGHIIVLATGHPAIQESLLETATGQRPEAPEKIALLRKESSPLALIPAQLEALQAAIASLA